MHFSCRSARPALTAVRHHGRTHSRSSILVAHSLHTGPARIYSSCRTYYTTIRTLNPAKLTPQDHVISLQPESALYGHDSCGIALRVRLRELNDILPRVHMRHTSLPPSPGHSADTLGGFLYYHQPPRAPPLAGMLRFRLTASNDPATFASGVDILTRRGIPWYIPLPSIASRKTYELIRRLLTDVDETVTPQVMELAARYSSRFTTGHVRGTRYLHSFGQTFYLSPQSSQHGFTFVGEAGLAHATLRSMTCYSGMSSSVQRRRSHPLSGQSISGNHLSQLTYHSDQVPFCVVLSRRHCQNMSGTVSLLCASCVALSGTPFDPIWSIQGHNFHWSSTREKANCWSLRCPYRSSPEYGQ